MGSQAIPLTLTKVDLYGADLQPGSESWAQVRAQVQQALESYGCFEAVYTRLPPELLSATFRSLQELFALPLATKLRNTSRKPLHAYIGTSPESPLYESMGIDLTEEVESFTSLLWPQGNPSFSEAICSFSKDVSELDHMVRRMVLESLGVEMYYDSHLESTNYLLRVMKYNKPETEEEKIGLEPHRDLGVVTIPCQDHEGLEIQTEDGEWLPISAPSNSLIVMVAQTFWAWTNGRVRPPLHRVMMSGSEDRYSIGLFSIPRPGQIVRAPEELVDEEHPLLFKPYNYHHFIRGYYSGEYYKHELPLKAYCGTV